MPDDLLSTITTEDLNDPNVRKAYNDYVRSTRDLNRPGQGVGDRALTGLGWTYQAAQTPFRYLFGKAAHAINPDRAQRDVGFDFEKALMTGDGVVWADDPSKSVGTVYDWAKGQDKSFDANIRKRGFFGQSWLGDWGSVDIPFTDQRLRFNPTVWTMNALEELQNPINVAVTFHAGGGDIADIATVLRGRALTGVRNPLAKLGLGGEMLMEGRLHKMMKPSEKTWEAAFRTLRESGLDAAEATRLADKASRGMSMDQLAGHVEGVLDGVDTGNYIQRLMGNNLEDYFTRGRIFNRDPMLPLRGRNAYNPVLPKTSFMDEMMRPMDEAAPRPDVVSQFTFDEAVPARQAYSGWDSAGADANRATFGDIPSVRPRPFSPFDTPEAIANRSTFGIGQRMEDPTAGRFGRGMADADVLEQQRIADDLQALAEEEARMSRAADPLVKATPEGDKPAKLLSDLVDSEEIDLLGEAQKLVQSKVRGLDAQDEALADIVSDTYRLMKNKPQVPGADPMNYVRSTMSNLLKKWFKKQNRQATREATILDAMAGSEDEAGSFLDSLSGNRGLRQASPEEIAIAREAGEDMGSWDRIQERFSLGKKGGTQELPEDLVDFLGKSPHVDKAEWSDSGLTLRMKNGARGVVKRMDNIEAPAAAKGYSTTEGMVAQGRYYMDVHGKGRIDLSRFATMDTPDHEMVHWARELGLFADDEWKSLTRRYARGVKDGAEVEEAIARGLAENLDDRTITQRIMDWFVDLYNRVSGNATQKAALEDWQQGNVWSRTPDAVQRPSLPFEGADDGMASLGDMIKLPKRTMEQMSAMGEAQSPKGYLFSLTDEPEPEWVTKGMRHIESPDFRSSVEKAFNSVQDFAKKARQDWKGALKELWEKEGAPRFTQRDIAVTKEMNVMFDRLQELDPKMANRFAMDPETIWRNASRMVGRIGEVISGRQSLKVLNDKTGEIAELYSKNMFEELQRPIREFLTSKYGKDIPDGAAKKLYEYADSYSAAKRIVREYDDMANELTKLVQGEDYNPHILAKLGADKAIEEQDIGALTNALEKWGKEKAGQGIEYHRNFIDWADKQKWAGAIQAKQKAHDEINRAVLTYAYRKRMLSKEVYAAYMRNADAYSPLKRVFDELDKTNIGKDGTLFKAFKGSDKDIKSPTAQLIANAHKVMTASDKNEAMMRVVQIAQEFPEEMADIVDVVPVKVGELARAGDTTAWLDGKQYRVRFMDPEAATQLERMRKVDNPNLFKEILRLPAKMLRASTALDPFFALVRNRIRDVANLPVISKHGATWADALAKMDEKDLRRYYESGAGFGGWMHDAEKAFVHDQARFMREMGRETNTVFTKFEDFVDTLKKGTDRLEGLTAKGEAKTRYAEWKKAYDYAMTLPNATVADAEAYAARTSAELLDFHQSGEWIRIINQYIPFVNPRVQGARVLAKAAARDPGQFGKQLALRVGLPSVGVYLMAKALGREEEYQNLPAYRRDYFWNIPGPAGTWITIPKPFEAGVMGTFLERGLDFTAGNKKAFDGYPASLMDAFSPLTTSDVAGPLKPFQEILSNKNAWTGEYIVPPHEENLDPRLRGGAQRASRLGRLLSGMFGGVMPGVDDPRQFEHLLQGLTSGYGRFAINVSRIGQEEGGKGAVDIFGGASGLLRKSSPYSALEVQELMGSQERKGLTRDKHAKDFRKWLRQANEGKVSFAQLLQKTRQEQKRIDRITIEDVLKKKKRRKP